MQQHRFHELYFGFGFTKFGFRSFGFVELALLKGSGPAGLVRVSGCVPTHV